jgi:hypothetical protein
MAFTDLVGSYLQNRMDTATRPFTDPSGYAADRFNSAFPGTTMETEEERRKRLEREAAERGNTEVASTTVKSYADGSQEEVKKTQIPAPEAAPAAPVAPQAAPAAPAPSTFDRMIQAESGGRQTGPDGQILTSPAGAQGMAQIMPSTAAQPGYGVKPATPEEIATPQGNRAFGERYYQGLLQHFKGDEQKAIAAYNAGPGRVQKNIQANNGQLNVAQLPQETQGYLNRVQGPVAPPAQVAQAPQPQAAPAPVAPEQQAPASPMIAGTPSSDVGATPTEQALKQQQVWQGDLKTAENDVEALYTIVGDKTGRYTPEVKQIAKDRAQQIDKAEQEKKQAETLSINAAKGDPKATNEMMRKLREKSEEGSYFKAYLYSRFGLNELAKEEQEKLAGPKFGQALVDGKQYFVETKGGAIVGAFDDTGARIRDDATLAKINTNYINPTKSDTGADVFYNPMVANGPRFAKVNTPTGATFREIGTNRPANAQEQAGLVKMSSAGPLEQQASAAYLKAGQGQRGKQAAEEGVAQAPLPSMSGGAPAQAAPAVSNTSTAVIPNPNQQAAGATAATGGSYAERKIAREVGGKRAESFNKIIDTEYREGAANGDIIVENRKKQYDILNRIDPGTNKGMAEIISGLYTAANEDPGNQKLTIVRDILTGKVGKNEDEVSQRIAQLNISPAAKSALQEYNALNAQIAGRTLRETAGPGAVSDAEQAANRARNVDITKAPMLGAYNMMGQSQFSGDIQRYKADLAATTDAPNATTFDRDFRKTQTELVKAYREVTEARLDWINKNGGATNPAAIRDGYKKYPVPEYDVSTGNWRYLKPLDKIFK